MPMLVTRRSHTHACLSKSHVKVRGNPDLYMFNDCVVTAGPWPAATVTVPLSA